MGLLLVDYGFTLAVIELGCNPASNKEGHNKKAVKWMVQNW